MEQTKSIIHNIYKDDEEEEICHLLPQEKDDLS
jgi:hypothetical protein